MDLVNNTTSYLKNQLEIRHPAVVATTW